MNDRYLPKYWKKISESEYDDLIGLDETEAVGQDEGGCSYRHGDDLVFSLLDGDGWKYSYYINEAYYADNQDIIQTDDFVESDVRTDPELSAGWGDSQEK